MPPQAITDALAPGPISLRIGLHTGTPLVTDEGYVGDDVHFAARVAAVRRTEVRSCSRSRLASLSMALSVTDLGEHRLKDIESAVSDLPARRQELPSAQDDLEHEPATARELVRRSRARAGRRCARTPEMEHACSRSPGRAARARLASLWKLRQTLVPAYKAGVFWVGLASSARALACDG